MYDAKIEILKEMVKNNELESCAIIGIPTKELRDLYFKFEDITPLFDKYQIGYDINEYDEASIGVYFEGNQNQYNKDVCVINIVNPTELQLYLIENNLLEKVIDCTQRRLMPILFAKIIGAHDSKLNFSDMLFLIPEKTQSRICEKIGKSRQAISDIKSGKNNLSVEILSKLMNLYPLLPWEQFIKGLTQ